LFRSSTLIWTASNRRRIEYVERHLQAFRTSAPAVAIDNHVCSYREPETDETFKFEPSPTQCQVLGDVKLTVKV